MKLSFWDILASMVMLAGLAMATIFINIFANPYSFINPFPPPTPISTLDVPTLTPSQRSLPDLWTATPETPGVPSPTEVMQTSTVTITGTVLVLPTGTSTSTPTKSPTPTKTASLTPNVALTYASLLTATSTKTPGSGSDDTTPPTNPGTPYTNSTSSDSTPDWLWTASSDENGISKYQITWGSNSSCENSVYTSKTNSWTAPAMTLNTRKYICVRAKDDAGNESDWVGPRSFSYLSVGAASITNVTDAPDPTDVGDSYTVTATVTVSGGTATGTVTVSDGTGASCTITLAGGTGSCSITSLTAGSKTLTASYSGDTTYAASSGTTMHTVDKADPTVNTWPSASSITYGQTLASSTLSGGDATPAGTFAWITPSTSPATGTSAQGVRFTPTNSANYNTVDGTVNITVNQATPTVSAWPTASAIIYGQTLADSTLSGGTASVTGSFAFTTPATAPDAGTYSASVTFTPTDAVNYTTVTGSVNVTVSKADPDITTWPSASDITYGDTLGDSTLSGEVVVTPGSFAFTSPGTTPPAGTNPYNVTFTPTDTSNYNTATNTVSVTVNQADQTISFDAPATGTNGGSATLSATATSGLTVTFTSTTPGVCSISGTTVNYLSAGDCTIDADQAGNSNYNAAPTVTDTIVVS